MVIMVGTIIILLLGALAVGNIPKLCKIIEHRMQQVLEYLWEWLAVIPIKGKSLARSQEPFVTYTVWIVFTIRAFQSSIILINCDFGYISYTSSGFDSSLLFGNGNSISNRTSPMINSIIQMGASTIAKIEHNIQIPQKTEQHDQNSRQQFEMASNKWFIYDVSNVILESFWQLLPDPTVRHFLGMEIQ